MQSQPAGAHGNLVQRFFAADVKALQLVADVGYCLYQQCGFADARIAAQQGHRACNQAAAQHAIQFADAGSRA
jgi:hypothetical protein